MSLVYMVRRALRDALTSQDPHLFQGVGLIKNGTVNLKCVENHLCILVRMILYVFPACVTSPRRGGQRIEQRCG